MPTTPPIEVNKDQDLIDYYFVEINQEKESLNLTNEYLRNRLLVLVLFSGISTSIFLVDIGQELKGYITMSLLFSLISLVLFFLGVLYCINMIGQVLEHLWKYEELHGSLRKLNNVSVFKEQNKEHPGFLKWLESYKTLQKNHLRRIHFTGLESS